MLQKCMGPAPPGGAQEVWSHHLLDRKNGYLITVQYFYQGLNPIPTPQARKLGRFKLAGC